MPEVSAVPLGTGKSMVAAVLFFDLTGFSSRAAALGNENTLYVLNIIIPTMIEVTKRWNGEIEKNTGDGIMAIFGTETRNSFIIARDTIEVAMAMRYVMLNVVNPILLEKGLQGFNFSIGIDMDSVLIANIGVPANHFLTVVGGAANRASQLQGLAGPNEILVGENIRKNIHPKLHQFCEERQHTSWQWKYTQSGTPYGLFKFTADWPEPAEWLRTKIAS